MSIQRGLYSIAAGDEAAPATGLCLYLRWLTHRAGKIQQSAALSRPPVTSLFDNADIIMVMRAYCALCMDDFVLPVLR